MKNGLLSFLGKAILIFVLLISASPAFAAKKIALVIGSDAYQNLPKLKKAVNDARSVSTALESIGFTVVKGENLTRREMSRSLSRLERLIEPGDQVFFFFAGHGVALGATNYLIPADMPLPEPGENGLVKDEAFAVDIIVRRIQSRGAAASYIVLDACRNNPFKTKGGRAIGTSRGLAKISAPEGVFVLFSAGIGQTALDRLSDEDPNPNSVFTRNLVPLLTQPGLSHVQLAKIVQSKVKTLAKKVDHKQQPAYYDQVDGHMYLVEGEQKVALQQKPVEKKAKPDSELYADERIYNQIKGSKSVAVLKAFIKKYPNSFYSTLLKARLTELESGEPKPKQPVVATPQIPVNKVVITKTDSREITSCDRLAAFPGDLNKLTQGVKFSKIEAAKAIPACRQALEFFPNNVRLIYQLGRSLDSAKKYTEAFSLMKIAAGKDYPAAAAHFGSMFVDGLGVKKSNAEAVYWFRKGAELGDANSMNRLGVMIEYGSGVDKSETEAVYWYQKAAEKGHVTAMNNLGVSYKQGQGVDKSDSEAVSWYRKAAEKGYAQAMRNLGFMLKNGRGVAKSNAEAVYWYRKAAELGDAKSMNRLGLMIENGQGVPNSNTEAASWYRKAAEKGNTQAMVGLAVFYDDGTGVSEKDPIKAAGFMYRSLQANNKLAIKKMTTNHSAWSLSFRREIQRKMKAGGYYTGTIDGAFGPATIAAIKKLAGR
ncbi:MAG: caspase family protein [Rhizobiaceae bacterium]